MLVLPLCYNVYIHCHQVAAGCLDHMSQSTRPGLFPVFKVVSKTLFVSMTFQVFENQMFRKRITLIHLMSKQTNL